MLSVIAIFCEYRYCWMHIHCTARPRRSTNRKVLYLVLFDSRPTFACEDAIVRNSSANWIVARKKRMSAHSVAASYKPPMLVTRVRLPVCALINSSQTVLLQRRSDLLGSLSSPRTLLLCAHIPWGLMSMSASWCNGQHSGLWIQQLRFKSARGLTICLPAIKVVHKPSK